MLSVKACCIATPCDDAQAQTALDKAYLWGWVLVCMGGKARGGGGRLPVVKSIDR